MGGEQHGAARQAANAPAAADAASMCRSHASSRSRSAAASGGSAPDGSTASSSGAAAAVSPWIGGHPSAELGPAASSRSRIRRARYGAAYARPRSLARVGGPLVGVDRDVVTATGRPAGPVAGRAASDQASCGSRRSRGRAGTTSPVADSTVPSRSAASTRLTGSTHPAGRRHDVLGRPCPQQRQQAAEPDVGGDAGREPHAPQSSSRRRPVGHDGAALGLDRLDLDGVAAAHPESVARRRRGASRPARAPRAVRPSRPQPLAEHLDAVRDRVGDPPRRVAGVPEVLHARHPGEREADHVELVAREPDLLVHPGQLDHPVRVAGEQRQARCGRDPCSAHALVPDDALERRRRARTGRSTSSPRVSRRARSTAAGGTTRTARGRRA